MGNISAGSATLPSATVQTQSQLSQGSVNGMLTAGVPDAAIGIANDIVGGLRTAQNGGFTPQTAQKPATTQVQPAANALDTPDPQYPGLTQAHATLLRAIGTPAAVITQLSNTNPNAGELEQYIQQNILTNPEGWDSYVGNPSGTARQGLQQLGILGAGSGQQGSPTQQTAPTQQTTPTQVNPTIGAPGTTGTQSVDQAVANGQNDIVKNLVWAAAGIGAAVIGYKLFKGHQAKAVQQVVEGGVQAASGAQNVVNGARTLANGGVANDAIQGMDAFARSGMGTPAMTQQIMMGIPVTSEAMGRAGNFALAYNHGVAPSLVASQIEMALQNGQADGLAHIYEAQAALKYGHSVAAVGSSAVSAASPLAKLLEGDSLSKLSKLAELL